VRSNAYDEADASLGSISASVENRLTLDAALPQLRDLEQRAVKLFYYGEYSKTEIARQMGISVNYAAYLVKRGVEHLRRIIESEAPLHTAKPSLPLPLEWADLARWIEDNIQPRREMRRRATDTANTSSETAPRRRATDPPEPPRNMRCCSVASSTGAKQQLVWVTRPAPKPNSKPLP
jgi:DNA-binding CsgD family transcriptional regulator